MNESAQLNEILGKVFDYLWEHRRAELSPDEYERRRYDFAFHMTD